MQSCSGTFETMKLPQGPCSYWCVMLPVIGNLDLVVHVLVQHVSQSQVETEHYSCPFVHVFGLQAIVTLPTKVTNGSNHVVCSNFNLSTCI